MACIHPHTHTPTQGNVQQTRHMISVSLNRWPEGLDWYFNELVLSSSLTLATLMCLQCDLIAGPGEMKADSGTWHVQNLLSLWAPVWGRWDFCILHFGNTCSGTKQSPGPKVLFVLGGQWELQLGEHLHHVALVKEKKKNTQHMLSPSCSKIKCQNVKCRLSVSMKRGNVTPVTLAVCAPATLLKEMLLNNKQAKWKNPSWESMREHGQLYSVMLSIWSVLSILSSA